MGEREILDRMGIFRHSAPTFRPILLGGFGPDAGLLRAGGVLGSLVVGSEKPFVVGRACRIGGRRLILGLKADLNGVENGR